MIKTDKMTQSKIIIKNHNHNCKFKHSKLSILNKRRKLHSKELILKRMIQMMKVYNKLEEMSLS